MLLDLLVWCDFQRSSESSRAGAASGGTGTDRPPGDETANNRIASLNGGNLTITSGSNHVTVATRFVDGAEWAILDAYV